MADDFKQTADAALRQLDNLQAGVARIGEAAEVGTSAGLVAHEIRNLLTPAVAYAQMALRAGSDPKSVRQALERAHMSMRRACEVSELILSYLRVERSDAAPSDAASSVSAVVADCVLSLGWDTPRPDFQLEIDVAKDVQVAIPPDALRHVVLNLLLNARTSLPATGGRISIGLVPPQVGSTWNSGPGGSQALLRIVDNGRGIEPVKLQRIRAGLATSAPSPSTQQRSSSGYRHAGLGLILCNRLLTANGAELRIESKENAGTVAIVELRTAA